ncbi:hypothetical protein EC957_001726 [Mortierella hygrophila]|uniref:Uncharacterized protein n=1 Tax=Mortierella hygrophila TaxID=979708 RepID=A0A9P6F4E6_9FUNG|nr:hypothetical protein EC957_001726 [Mortierella hygrophila]
MQNWYYLYKPLLPRLFHTINTSNNKRMLITYGPLFLVAYDHAALAAANDTTSNNSSPTETPASGESPTVSPPSFLRLMVNLAHLRYIMANFSGLQIFQLENAKSLSPTSTYWAFVSCPLSHKDFHLKLKDLEDYIKSSEIRVASEVAAVPLGVGCSGDTAGKILHRAEHIQEFVTAYPAHILLQVAVSQPWASTKTQKPELATDFGGEEYK